MFQTKNDQWFMFSSQANDITTDITTETMNS